MAPKHAFAYHQPLAQQYYTFNFADFYTLFDITKLYHCINKKCVLLRIYEIKKLICWLFKAYLKHSKVRRMFYSFKYKCTQDYYSQLIIVCFSFFYFVPEEIRLWWIFNIWRLCKGPRELNISPIYTFFLFFIQFLVVTFRLCVFVTVITKESAARNQKIKRK